MNMSLDEQIREEKRRSAKRGEYYCSATKHTCNEDGKEGYVNVCHYSSMHGYSTLCIPEADSDVFSYYPHDYCGECKGGFETVTDSNETEPATPRTQE